MQCHCLNVLDHLDPKKCKFYKSFLISKAIILFFFKFNLFDFFESVFRELVKLFSKLLSMIFGLFVKKEEEKKLSDFNNIEQA